MRVSFLSYLASILLLACSGSSTMSVDVGKQDGTADFVQEWLIGALEDVSQVQIADASQFLQSLTKTTPQQVLRSDGLFLFWMVNMTESQAEESLKHPVIASVEPDMKLIGARVPPARSNIIGTPRSGVRDTAACPE